MTPFRKPQARLAVEGLVRGLAPHMASVTGTRALREVVAELARDERLWAELNHGQPLVVRGRASMLTSPLMEAP